MTRAGVSNQRGSALIGAMAAVTISGILGGAMISYYQSILKQSRAAYVRSLMTTLNEKVRFMGSQPYAYICGSQRDGATDADGTGGIKSCVVNETYFAGVTHVSVPGAACPTSAPCGFTLTFRPPAAGTTHPPLDYTNAVNPNTGETELTGLLPYVITYDGTEFAFRPEGYDLAQSPVGLPVAREVLQSEVFDCGEADPTHPVFSGFDNDTGMPICRGFGTCARYTYGIALNFKALTMTCMDMRTPDKQRDCTGGGQRKIGALSFANGILSSVCDELPAAPLVSSDPGAAPPPGAPGGAAVPPSSPATASPVTTPPTGHWVRIGYMTPYPGPLIGGCPFNSWAPGACDQLGSICTIAQLSIAGPQNPHLYQCVP